MIKRAILIIGNVASGKSTISKMVIDRSSKYKYVSLDAERLKLHASNKNMDVKLLDRQAIHNCEKKLNGEFILFESNGVSKFYHHVKRILKTKGYKILTIKLKCDQRECKRRLKNRVLHGQLQAPFSYGKKYGTIEDTITYFDKHLDDVPANIVFNSQIDSGDKISAEIVRRCINNDHVWQA